MNTHLCTIGLKALKKSAEDEVAEIISEAHRAGAIPARHRLLEQLTLADSLSELLAPRSL